MTAQHVEHYVEQVGGDHYGTGYGHWDLMDDGDFPYLEAVASKYLCRWEDKNGIEDLQKAISYIDKRLVSKSMAQGIRRSLGCFQMYQGEVDMWFKHQGIKPWERAVCRLVLGWKEPSDLEYAKTLILAQIKHEENKKGIKHD